MGVYEAVQLTRVEAQARTIAKSLADLRARQEASSASPRKADAGLEARLVELTTELKARQDVVEALKRGTVGSTTGFSEYLRAFSRQRVEGVWLTGFDISVGGSALTITGRALNADLVPTYLQRLNHEPPMQGRQFASVSINRPGAKIADAKDAPTTLAALPPYLDFVISSEEKPEGRTAPKTPGASIALRAPLDAELRGKKATPVPAP
jgi:hypothetical protein